MQRFFLGMTLGGDPHTLGIYKAGRIARMGGIPFEVLPPDYSDEEKLKKIAELKPQFLGFSYRLSADKALIELRKILCMMETYGLYTDERKICFAGLLPTLQMIHESKIDQRYSIKLMGSYDDLGKTTANTAAFFGFPNKILEMIVETIVNENKVPSLTILDELAKEVIHGDTYNDERPLAPPSKEGRVSLVKRIQESEIPLIRSHFGIPADSIEPTIEGIIKIATEGAVDEISLGSSDLSQRYFGCPDAFEGKRNDGGVPYKTEKDLVQLRKAAMTGNFPSMKPYCHVKDMIPFVDVCLKTGMLEGAHQAVPLFWFSELDGRGDLSVDEAIDEHIKTIQYLAQRGIPTEMNDPNQWSSRYAHDTVFITDYALIAAVMYMASSANMIFQMQFNKPADTGDYGDISKFNVVRKLIEDIRPAGNNSRIILETRAGIEHFSGDQNKAKWQLARSVLLQMLFSPQILHLVSFCEADHVASAEDVIESSKLLRRAIKVFKKNETDIRKSMNTELLQEREEYLIDQSRKLIKAIGNLGGCQKDIHEKYSCAAVLADSEVLKKSIKYRLMAAPGITNLNYSTPEMMTHVGKIGEINCYRNWEDTEPIDEVERIQMLRRYYS